MSWMVSFNLIDNSLAAYHFVYEECLVIYNSIYNRGQSKTRSSSEFDTIETDGAHQMYSIGKLIGRKLACAYRNSILPESDASHLVAKVLPMKIKNKFSTQHHSQCGQYYSRDRRKKNWLSTHKTIATTNTKKDEMMMRRPKNRLLPLLPWLRYFIQLSNMFLRIK